MGTGVTSGGSVGATVAVGAGVGGSTYGVGNSTYSRNIRYTPVRNTAPTSIYSSVHTRPERFFVSGACPSGLLESLLSSKGGCSFPFAECSAVLLYYTIGGHSCNSAQYCSLFSHYRPNGPCPFGRYRYGGISTHRGKVSKLTYTPSVLTNLYVIHTGGA